MKKKFLTLLFTGIVGMLFAQEKTLKAFSLKEAVDYALEYNNNAKNGKLGELQAKARNWEITSVGLPTISAEVGYTYYFKRPVSPAFNSFFSDTTTSTSRVFGYLAANDPAIRNILVQSAIDSKDNEFSFVLPHNFSSSISVSQLIFDGRYVIGLKATKDFMKTARLQNQMSQTDVKYTVMKAYYQAAAAKESNILLAENLKLVDKLLSDTRATFKEGLIEELDVNRLELAQAQLQSQINLQQQFAKVALDNLKFQMGYSLNDEIILKDNLESLRAAVPIDAQSSFDVKQRSEYELLETAIRIRGYDVAQRRSGYFPSLFGFLNYGWQAQANNFGDYFKKTTTYYPDGDTRRTSPWFDQGLVGLTLKLPIFDSGQKMANVKQAKIDKLKTENDFENFKAAAELQFRASRTQFESAVVDAANTQRTLELSKKIFNKNQVKYKEGLGSSFELVQSESEFSQNQLKAIQSALNLLNSKADLDKALGVK
jgi:outer membrane protein TolC